MTIDEYVSSCGALLNYIMLDKRGVGLHHQQAAYETAKMLMIYRCCRRSKNSEENERATAGQGGRICLARPDSIPRPKRGQAEYILRLLCSAD